MTPVSGVYDAGYQKTPAPFYPGTSSLPAGTKAVMFMEAAGQKPWDTPHGLGYDTAPDARCPRLSHSGCEDHKAGGYIETKRTTRTRRSLTVV
jgi:hypothetical protein